MTSHSNLVRAPPPPTVSANGLVERPSNQQVSIDGQMQRGNHAVNVPVQITSTTAIPPRPARCPPPPPPMENKMAIVPVYFQHPGQGGTQGMGDEPKEMSVDELDADILRHYEAFGKAVVTNFSCLKDKLRRSSEAEVELRVVNKALIAQFKEITLVNAKNEKEVRKAEKQVQQAKSEEAIWKKNYMQINGQLIAVKNELKEKNTAIVSLKDTTTELLNDLEKKVLDLETNERKQNEELEDKEKQLQMVERKYKEMCAQFLKLHDNSKDLITTKETLNSKIDDFEKKDEISQATIQSLEAQRNHLQESVEKLQAKVSERSQELEKERKDNQVAGLELEKKTKRIQELGDQVKALEKEKDDLPKTFDTLVKQFKSRVFPKKRTRRAAYRSSSPEKETDVLLPVAVNEENEIGARNKAAQLETLDVGRRSKRKTPFPNTIGKKARKSGIKKKQKRSGKAKRPATAPNDDDDEPQQQISPTYLNKTFYSGGDSAEPEVNVSSMASNGPSVSGTQQRKTRQTT